MNDNKPKALISVWDKDGIVELARALESAGYEIVSSSGTAKHLESAGVAVTETADLTGLPSILGGRVKTLHPTIMGAILARTDVASDERDREAHGIALIDIVVCTLYPFEETAKGSPTTDELIEKIDIGGVSLIRAAAKNHARVAVVTDRADYEAVAQAVRGGGISAEMRRRFAVKAFLATALYDATIHDGLSRELGVDTGDDELVIPLRRAQSLRYGENPHQSASLYMPTLAKPAFDQLSGKELSYNNLLDLDTLLKAQAVFKGSCACVIVKHTTPCGAAEAESLDAAYERALACDPVSAFGGIVGFTGRVTISIAQKLTEHFYEIVAAPSFDDDAVKYIADRKPNVRVLVTTGAYAPSEQLTANAAGWLAESIAPAPEPVQAEGKWVGTPRPDLWDDLLFAWRCASLTKSNAIVLAKGRASVGIGGGFTNRVDAAEYAVKMAGDKSNGAVLASDAFFPFPDTVELASRVGVVAIIQPGGSIRDKESEEAAVRLGISMFVGGPRTFRH